MRILNATIFGFGKWVDHSIDFSKEGMTCIYGQNESGKSTIQKFILFMLFGLPPKQREYYRPKTSGKMGGRLTLSFPDEGRLIVERMDHSRNGAAVCYGEDGTVYEETWLQQKLDGLTVKTYESIFSFSALDLTKIKTMDEEDLGEVLLGIGLTGSSSIYSIERSLDAQLGELFKPSGKKPKINRQLNEMDQTAVALRRFQETESEYRDKKEAVDQQESELEDLQEHLKTATAKLHSAERQLHAFPIIEEYRQLKEQLDELPPEKDFPERGVERYQMWKQKLLPLVSRKNILLDNEKRYRVAGNTIKTEMHLEHLIERAEKLLEKAGFMQARSNEAANLREAIKEMERDIHEELERMDIGQQLEELDHLRLPFHLEKAWLQIRSETEQLQLELNQLVQKEKELRQEKSYFMDQMRQLEDNLLPEDLLRELQDKVKIYERYHLMDKVNQDNERAGKAWTKKRKAKESRASSILKACSAAGILLIGIGWFGQEAWMYPVGMGILLAGVIQQILTRKSLAEFEKMVMRDKTEDDRQVSDYEYREALELLELHDQHKNELLAVREQEKGSRVQAIKWQERRRLFEERDARLQNQIESQYALYPFLDSVEIAYWPEFYHGLKNLLKQRADCRQQEVILENLLQELKEYHGSVEALLQELDLPTYPEGREQKLKLLQELVRKQQENAKALEQYDDFIEETVQELDKLDEEMKVYDKEIRNLFDLADVRSEDEFYESARQLDERKEILDHLKKLEVQLRKSLPDAVVTELVESGADLELLEELHAGQAAEKAELEAALENVRDRLATAKAELAAMESSDSYSASMHHYEMQKDSLQSLAREWAILKTAKEMLRKTKADYQEKYLKKVMSQAVHYFREITSGTYINIFPPSESMVFHVESANNLRYAVNELSQGTIDQLYISLRLAVSETMSEEYGLPFIIDDAFVHFDAVRTKKIMHILQEISARQQIILFTCKKEIMGLAGAGRIVDLSQKMLGEAKTAK